MGDEASGAKAYLYVILCGLERAKIGGRRLRFEDRPTDIKHVVFPPEDDIAEIPTTRSKTAHSFKNGPTK